MKYDCEIEIDLPRSKVVELFANVANMQKWQKGFISMEHLEGIPGQPGARSKLHYKMGKRELTMVETITKNELPERMDMNYDAKGVHNVLHNHFEEIGPNKTRWRTHNEFQMETFFMKLMAFLMPGAFRKQSMAYLKDFKTFAESNLAP